MQDSMPRPAAGARSLPCASLPSPPRAAAGLSLGGQPSKRPTEPCEDEDIGVVLGRHLELLGHMLQHRRSLQQQDTDAALMRSELELSGFALMQELCPVPLDGVEVNEVIGKVLDSPSPFPGDHRSPPSSLARVNSQATRTHSLTSWDTHTRAEATTSTRLPRRNSILTNVDVARGSRVGFEREKSGSLSFQPSDFAAMFTGGASVLQKTSLQRFVTHPYFETFFSALIAINTVAMIVEEQYVGSEIGFGLKVYENYGSPEFNGQHFPGIERFFNLLEYMFAAIFTVEAFLRMLGRGWAYWRDRLELLDLFIVICSNVSIFLQNSAINIQLFRLLRTSKILRMLKLIRKVEGFDSLHLMTTALTGSGFTLMWSVMLLVIMQSLVAMILGAIFRTQYIMVPGVLNDEQARQLFLYFGTYTRSMLSTFELTFANWPQIARFMTENLHEGWMLFAIVYKLTFGFAIIGVINAVFIQETFKVASSDDSIMVRAKLRAAKLHKKKMEKLFKHCDVDGNGTVSVNEFRTVLQDPSIQTWLSSMDLDASDAELLFKLLSESGTDCLSVNDLVKGIARLQGPARSIDVRLIVKAMKEQWAAEEQDVKLRDLE